MKYTPLALLSSIFFLGCSSSPPSKNPLASSETPFSKTSLAPFLKLKNSNAKLDFNKVIEAFGEPQKKTKDLQTNSYTYYCEHPGWKERPKYIFDVNQNGVVKTVFWFPCKKEDFYDLKPKDLISQEYKTAEKTTFHGHFWTDITTISENSTGTTIYSDKYLQENPLEKQEISRVVFELLNVDRKRSLSTNSN